MTTTTFLIACILIGILFGVGLVFTFVRKRPDIGMGLIIASIFSFIVAMGVIR